VLLGVTGEEMVFKAKPEAGRERKAVEKRG
jgi:hypothetical protein